MIYALITIGGVLETISAIGRTTGGAIPTFTTYIIAGWIFAILQHITGLITLIAGVAFLVQK